MKTVLVALLCALAACGGMEVGAVVPQEVNGIEVAVRHSTKLSGCSAVEVGHQLVVTAKHCVDEGVEVGDVFETGRLTYISPMYDFAVFKSTSPLTYAGDFIDMRPGLFGEHLYVVGFPSQMWGGQDLTITDGLIAGPFDEDFQQRITAPMYFGNSGGGVWGNDGALLGIAVSIYAARIEGNSRPVPYAAQSYMVPILFVKAAL